MKWKARASDRGRWFAWHPVLLSKQSEWVWLEAVYRYYGTGGWVYYDKSQRLRL